MAGGEWVYLNGDIIPAQEARISIYDHGFLYGDGVFEGIRSYNGRVFKLDEHLDRLYKSAKAIKLDIGMTREEMARAVTATVAANRLDDAYIRLVVSRGPGDLGLDPLKCPKPTVLIIAAALQLYPEEVYEKGMRLASVPVRRPAPDALNPNMKTLNYLTSILAKVEANQRGLPEVVLLNSQGYVTEGTGDNLFIVVDGGLVTAPPWVGILTGITRKTVMELAREQNIPVREDVFTLFDLYNADECFLTGTAAEVVPAVEVDGRPIGSGRPGPITQRLREAFHAYARRTGTPVYSSETRSS
ncbi:MAG: branched-chain-amino-acid transaminase [Actinomycetia bacterium]|nr:branched-chain-amino-acid transaminase [Actinomycetes bacterium]